MRVLQREDSLVCSRTQKAGTMGCAPGCLSHVRIFATLWAVALQAPLSMGFSMQEYWGGLPCPPPEDLPDPGVEPMSLTSPALAHGFFPTSATWEAQHCGGSE